MDHQTLLISLTAIIALGIASQWLGWVTRIPSIVILLIVGLIAGPVSGWIRPNEILGDLLVPIVSLSVAVILFEGGLRLLTHKVREVGPVIGRLIGIGAVTSALLSYLFLHYILGFSPTYSLLQSAVLVITGPTVIIPMLNQLHMKEPVRTVLRWEGIIIDPIGAVIAVLLMEAVLAQSTAHAAEAVFSGVAYTLVVGVGMGVLSGYLILVALRRFWLVDAHHNPMVLMVVLLTYVVSNLFQHESGLISVTVMGVVLGNQKQTGVRHVIEFKETLRVILIAFLFIVLAAITDLEAVRSSLGPSLALVAFLVLVARPLSVAVATWGSSLTWKERLFVACLAPRGIVTAAVASLFGLTLAGAGYPDAHFFAPVTFVVIAGTVLFYGVFSPFLARKLNLSHLAEQGVLIIGANRVARLVGEALQDEGYKVQLIDTNFWKVQESRKHILPVFLGNFLAFEAEHEEDLEEIGMLLALTESDDINSLAVVHFTRYFDQADMYQLPATTERIPDHLLGRPLFREDCTMSHLKAMLDAGWQVRTTSLTKEFQFADWKEYYANEAVPLFFVQDNGLISPWVAERKPHPKVQEGRLIFLAEAQETEAEYSPT